MKNNKLNENEFEFINFLCLVIIFIFLGVLNFRPVMPFGKTGGSVLQASTGSDVRFYYDGGGQRIAKLNPLGDNSYYISPNLEIVFKRDGTNFWRKNYYFNGKVIAVRTTEARDLTPIPNPTGPVPTKIPTPNVPPQTNIPTPLPTTIPVGSSVTIPSVTPTLIPSPGQPANTPPVVESGNLRSGTVNQNYTEYIVATDADLCYDNLTMWASNLPRGLSVQSCNQYSLPEGKRIVCTISGRPTTSGTRNVTLYVNDGYVTSQKVLELRILSEAL